MELRSLRALVEVIRQGGFSKAGKVLFATQSTVSKAVRQLEDEVGEPLLERLPAGPRLTPAGEVVYRRGLRLLAEREDLLSELDELRGGRRGVLHLGLPLLGSAALFAPPLIAFRRRYPGIELRLVEDGAARLEEQLLSGGLELASLLLPAAPELAWRPMRAEPLLMLVPAKDRLARKASVRLKELADRPFLLFEHGFALNRIILSACRRNGYEPTVVARSGQPDFLLALVAAGLGVGFLPRLVARAYARRDVALVRLDEPDTEWQLVLAWRKASHLSAAGRAWLEVVEATLTA